MFVIDMEIKWTAGTKPLSWPIIGAVILGYLKIPIHTTTTILMMGLNQWMWLRRFPSHTLRSPLPSSPGYYTVFCARTLQVTIPFYRPWGRHYRLRQTSHLWVLSLWTMMASLILQYAWRSWRTFLPNIGQRPPKFRMTTAHRSCFFLLGDNHSCWVGVLIDLIRAQLCIFQKAKPRGSKGGEWTIWRDVKLLTCSNSGFPFVRSCLHCFAFQICRGVVGILGVTTQRRHSKSAVTCNLDADCTCLRSS